MLRDVSRTLPMRHSEECVPASASDMSLMSSKPPCALPDTNAPLSTRLSARDRMGRCRTTAPANGFWRPVLEDRGLGAAFGHGTGHGLGLDVHEEPRITWPRADVPSVLLEPGMVFTIEPGAYLSGFGGVRIEDDVLVTETGSEVLTQVSRELQIVG